MGWIVETPAGTYRVNWRDPAGKQRARTFRTKKEAQRFDAQVEHEAAQGTYVDPDAARRVLLRDYADQRLTGLNVEPRTREKCLAMLRTHVLPKCGDWPLSKIDHVSVQQWATDLGTRRAPATVREAFDVLSRVLDMAVRARLLATNPGEGVRLPSTRAHSSDLRTVSRAEFRDRLLPEVPDAHRALVSLAAGAGLRWGEDVGLGWSALDLDAQDVYVRRVVVETSGRCQLRDYPKSRAGVRRVPLPAFTIDALVRHREHHRNSDDLVVATRSGLPVRRSTWRAQVLAPTLHRAGLVGLRFHDLRHSYATWLVSEGVPVNVVQRLMGHESAATPLALYVHAAPGLRPAGGGCSTRLLTIC